MDYQKHYDLLIEKHGFWLKPKGVYTERHRKLPGYLGGRYVKGNAFYMSARTHYVAHLLWAKITNDGQAWGAIKCMGSVRGRQNSKMYQKARILHAQRLSILFSGENHPQYGTSPSVETRKKMSEASLGKPKSIEMRKKLSATNMGHKVSKESIEKTRKGLLGKKKSVEFCKQVSERMKGNKHLLGHVHSEETRNKISEKGKGRKHTREAIDKISKSKIGENNPMYGKPSPRKGVTLSEETKRKISESRLRRNNVIA